MNRPMRPRRTCRTTATGTDYHRRARRLATALMIGLSACTRAAPQPVAQDTGVPLNAHWLIMPAVDPLPAHADGQAVWADLPATAGAGARFGVPGADPLLTIACHDGRLVITRWVAAELGAGALFAIEGRRQIVRVPVDATALPGHRGYVWQGAMAGTDPDTEVFSGPFTGTLPGGGLITVTAGEAPRDVIRQCRTNSASKPG